MVSCCTVHIAWSCGTTIDSIDHKVPQLHTPFLSTWTSSCDIFITYTTVPLNTQIFLNNWKRTATIFSSEISSVV